MTWGQLEQIVTERVSTAADCCLVISSRSDRQRMMMRAAEDAGWEIVAHSDPASGWREIQRGDIQLSLLDIQDSDLVELEEMRELAQALGRQPDHLLIVCGNQGDPLEELWVRQAGAWLYLPGIEDQTDLAVLCQEAWSVARRLQRRALAAGHQPQLENDKSIVGRREAAMSVMESEFVRTSKKRKE